MQHTMEAATKSGGRRMVRVLTLAAMLAAGSAQAFTINMDFDGQKVGDKCKGIGSGKSYITTDHAVSEPNSCTFWIEEGDTGWGTWGGTIGLPKDLHEGDEIWIRARVYMPDGFEAIAPGEGGRLKFMRLKTRENGKSVGYNDILFNKESSSASFAFGYEGFNRWYMGGSEKHRPNTGRWETYEWYMHLSSQRGVSTVRWWKNGELLIDTDQRRTLKTSETYATSVYLGTYWNGGAPRTQKMYVDDLVITTDQPEARDTHGNAFFGVSTPPSPPQFSVR